MAAFGVYVRLWPRPAVLWGARLMGLAAYAFLRHDRRVAYANLDIVLGDTRTRAEKRRIVRRTFQRAAETLVGMLWFPRLTADRAWEVFEGEEVLARLKAIGDRGKGLVLVTAHYGDWELLCYAAALLGFTMLMVTEPLRNRLLDGLITRLRTGSGNRTVPPRFALIKLFRGLKGGDRVAMMADVNGRRGRGGVWLDLFGLSVFNGTAMAELALRTGSVVVFAAAMPLPGGRVRLVCRDPVEFTPTGDHPADVRALSQQVLDQCRDLIRDDPEPWLWTYKRWKRRPTPNRDGYPFYSKYAATE